MSKAAAVYMMPNKPKGVLYIGSTDNLHRRISEHKIGRVEGFTKKYKLNYCVYLEICSTTREAMVLERRYKKYNRQWKIDLIESINPHWEDLSDKLNELVVF